MAKDFDSTSDYLEYANSTALDFSTSDVIAFSIWYQFHSYDTGQKACLLTNSNSGALSDAPWLIRIGNLGTEKFEFIYKGASGFHVWGSTNQFSESTSWRHLAFSYTYGTGGSPSLYIDGTSEGGSWTTLDGTEGPSGSGYPTRFMRNRQASVVNAIDGFLGDVLIYKNPGVNAQFLSRMRFSPWRYMRGAVLAIRGGMVGDAADPDLSGKNHSASKGGTLAQADHSPTAPLSWFSGSLNVVIQTITGNNIASGSSLFTPSAAYHIQM